MSAVEYLARLVVGIAYRLAAAFDRRIAERAGVRPEACYIVCADYFVRGTIQDDGVFNVFHASGFYAFPFRSAVLNFSLNGIA